jgi:uncharacterized protein (TIGR02246 family)
MSAQRNNNANPSCIIGRENRMTTKRMPLFAFLAVVLAGSSLTASEEQPRSKEEETLHKNAEAFVQAFNKGDAKAVAAFWAPEGDYVDQLGRHLKGRKTIEKAFQKLFAERKGGKLYITVLSLRVIKPDLAVEDGVTEVVPPDGGPPSSSRYTIVHVKHEGKWYLDSVREAVVAPPSNHEHLEDLEWLVGEWTEDSDKPESVKVAYSWVQNQNFLVASFGVTLKDVPVSGGVQWIAWDAAGKRIRSWSFDSNGGFSEGSWSQDGSAWTIKTGTTLRDGKKASATNTITKIDDDHATWQSTKRTLDDKELPDVKPVKLKRVK